MTQEEKAKAYDEALAKAREFYDSPRTCFIIDQLCEMFPSLTESEDERIIHCLEEIIDWGCSKNIAVECGVDLKAVKSWLEKQKEQNVKKFPFLLGDAVPYDEGYNKGYEDALNETKVQEWSEDGKRLWAVEILKQHRYYWENAGATPQPPKAVLKTDLIEALNIAIDCLEKQKEQKPEEIWPNLSNCIHNCKNCLARCLYRKEENPEQKPAEIAPNQFDGVTYGMSGHSSEKPAEYPMTPSECYKPAEWSEEDENMFNDILLDMADRREMFKFKGETTFAENMQKKIDWLDSHHLQLKYQSSCSQPKQEWSEEDEKKIKDIIEYLECWNDFDHGDEPYEEYRARFKGYISFMKSLRPHWKPSEEQIHIIGLAIANLEPIGHHSLCCELEQLKADLKKL